MKQIRLTPRLVEFHLRGEWLFFCKQLSSLLIRDAE